MRGYHTFLVRLLALPSHAAVRGVRKDPCDHEARAPKYLDRHGIRACVVRLETNGEATLISTARHGCEHDRTDGNLGLDR